MTLTSAPKSGRPTVRASVPWDDQEEAAYLDAGALKGSGGDQTYSLPSDLDPNAYHAVVIWCKRFAENFAYAPLSGDVDSQAD